MTQRAIGEFKIAFKNSGLDHSEITEQQTVSKISYGNFSIADNPRLFVSLCNTVAQKTKAFWTYQEFIALQNRQVEKLEKPDPEDQKFDPSNVRYEKPLDRKLAKAIRYNNALEIYEKEAEISSGLRAQIRNIRAANQFNEQGYLAYVSSTLQTDFPAFVESFFFASKSFHINERARRKHTFICAGTGSGKSQTMLHLIRHYLTKNTEPALVILDPHGDLANDTARFTENASNGRLVYIKPNLFNGRQIAFNPFDCTAEERQEKALYRRQMQFRGALEQINGEPFSKAQKPFILPVLGVLLHMEGTSFKDLVRFMDDERNGDLVKYGQTALPNEVDRDFFKHRFNSRNYESTKEALGSRFSEIIGDPTIRDFLCNESTFDLPASLKDGKVIVFHFDQNEQSKQAITTIGQLINAYLVSYAMARPANDRRPIHLFADECQYFISPTIEEIMGETRKFGLYATLATQRTNQVGKDLLDAILGNVGCYMIGRNKGKTADVMGKEQPITADEIKELKPLHFYQIELDREPVKTKIDVVSGKHRLTGEAWRQVLLEQGRLYYRSDTPPAPPEYNSRPDLNQANQARTPKPLIAPMFDGPDFSKKAKRNENE